MKDVRDLRGVIEREDAEMGILITLADPTGTFRCDINNRRLGDAAASPWPAERYMKPEVNEDERFNGAGRTIERADAFTRE